MHVLTHARFRYRASMPLSLLLMLGWIGCMHHRCLHVPECTTHAIPQVPQLLSSAVPEPHGRARSPTVTLISSSQPACLASLCGSPPEERRTGPCIRHRPSSAPPSCPTRPRRCRRGRECPSDGRTPSLLVRLWCWVTCNLSWHINAGPRLQR